MPKVALRVNGEDVPLNLQMQSVLAEVNLGVMRTLRGTGDVASFEIRFEK